MISTVYQDQMIKLSFKFDKVTMWVVRSLSGD